MLTNMLARWNNAFRRIEDRKDDSHIFSPRVSLNLQIKNMLNFEGFNNLARDSQTRFYR